MDNLEELLKNNDKYLDYNKVLKELLNQYKSFQKDLRIRIQELRNYNWAMVDYIQMNFDKSKEDKILLKKSKKTSEEAKKLSQKESSKNEKVHMLLKLKTDELSLQEKLNYYDIVIPRFKKLINKTRPIWKNIEKERNTLSKTIMKNYLIIFVLKFFPAILLSIVVGLAFINKEAWEYLSSFSKLKTFVFFFVLVLIYYWVSKRIINIFYELQLKKIVLQYIRELSELNERTTKSVDLIEKEYEKFYHEITKVDIGYN